MTMETEANPAKVDESSSPLISTTSAPASPFADTKTTATATTTAPTTTMTPVKTTIPDAFALTSSSDSFCWADASPVPPEMASAAPSPPTTSNPPPSNSNAAVKKTLASSTTIPSLSFAQLVKSKLSPAEEAAAASKSLSPSSKIPILSIPASALSASPNSESTATFPSAFSKKKAPFSSGKQTGTGSAAKPFKKAASRSPKDAPSSAVSDSPQRATTPTSALEVGEDHTGAAAGTSPVLSVKSARTVPSAPPAVNIWQVRKDAMAQKQQVSSASSSVDSSVSPGKSVAYSPQNTTSSPTASWPTIQERPSTPPIAFPVPVDAENNANSISDEPKQPRASLTSSNNNNSNNKSRSKDSHSNSKKVSLTPNSDDFKKQSSNHQQQQRANNKSSNKDPSLMTPAPSPTATPAGASPTPASSSESISARRGVPPSASSRPIQTGGGYSRRSMTSSPNQQSNSPATAGAPAYLSSPTSTGGRGGRGRGRGGNRYNGSAPHSASPREYYGSRHSPVSPQGFYQYMPVVDVEMVKFYVLGQIEYYFSVENLCRDIYFRKQMDDQGFVPLDLIAGFNRVRVLTTDMAVIKQALQNSALLELVEDRVRRKTDWEHWVLAAEQRAAITTPTSSPVVASISQPADPKVAGSKESVSSEAIAAQ